MLALTFFILTTGLAALWMALAARGRSWDHLPLPEGRIMAIVPAYQEPVATLHGTIEALLGQTVQPDVIHVVDDGSDEPLPVYEHERVIWHRIPNGGKRHAQSAALAAELMAQDGRRPDFIVTVDSDSAPNPDCLERCLRALSDRRVQAVTATVAVLNRTHNWLTRVTDLEMVYGCLVTRGARTQLGAVAPTAGTFAIYRSAIMYDNLDDYLTSGTAGDDRRLTHYSLLRGQVVAVEEAIVHTVMPDTVSEMYDQRVRWFKSYFRYLPWELRNFTGAPLWLRAWNVLLVVLYPVIIAWALIVMPLMGHGVYWQAFVYWAVLMYCQTFRYVTFERPDMSLGERLLAWLVWTPVLIPVSTLILRPAQYRAITQANTTHWGTRGDTAAREAVDTTRAVPTRAVAAVIIACILALGSGAAPRANARTVKVGIASDPGPWKQLGKYMDFRATYQSWGHDADPAEVVARGDTMTWEPWRPVPPTTGYAVPQPAYANERIAAGVWDDYLRRWARAVKATGRPFFIRYAHEMNGVWMTWSAGDPRQYIAAWRHVVRVFRQEGATNARFIWAPNVNGFQDDATFERMARLYWPGRAYVDQVGLTLVRFKQQPWTMPLAERRMRWLVRLSRRPLVLAEVKVYREGRGSFLRGLGCAVARVHSVVRVVWAETPSKGQSVQPWVGDMNWSLAQDAAARRLLLAIRHPRCG